jgi:hypothetical protein
VLLGKLGGKARLIKMTPERRKEVAKIAAQARWGAKRKPRNKAKRP